MWLNHKPKRDVCNQKSEQTKRQANKRMVENDFSKMNFFEITADYVATCLKPGSWKGYYYTEYCHRDLGLIYSKSGLLLLFAYCDSYHPKKAYAHRNIFIHHNTFSQ